MLHVPNPGYTYFAPARFAGVAGIYVMKITLKNGTFTKIGTTYGGHENRTAEWGENQQVFRFLDCEDEETRRFIEYRIRKTIEHDGYPPLKYSNGTQSKDWFAEEALNSAIRAIEKWAD